MIVDTSALVAVLLQEDGAEQYEQAMAEEQSCRMSVVTFLEAAIVIENRLGEAGGRELDALVNEASIGLEPVTSEHALAARQAWRRFGKGNHPASLNFGDCFAYALAAVTGEPLLFKGRDFTLTDVTSALDMR